MSSHNKSLPLSQAGFSLVEIMVGLVIGLLATMVIMQVFSVFEGQKRTTTGSADAQTNGSIALYTIQREALMAGYGLPVFDSTNPPLDCTALTAPAAGDDITPITITDGALATASDTITVRYGDNPSGGAPVEILTGTAAPTAQVNFNLGCVSPNPAASSVLVVNNAALACTLTNFTNLSASGVSPVTITLANGANMALKASLTCLGNWNQINFSVNGNQLQRAGNPVVTDIVNMQAQYGVSASAASDTITQWVDATGAWAAPAVADRNRIKAIRVAVVARNGLMEKGNVTTACITTKGTANNGPCAWDDSNVNAAPLIDLSNTPNWQRYRYRVFETIIPLRSMIW